MSQGKTRKTIYELYGRCLWTGIHPDIAERTVEDKGKGVGKGKSSRKRKREDVEECTEEKEINNSVQIMFVQPLFERLYKKPKK